MRLSRRSLECLGVAVLGASVLHIMPARATLALTAAGTADGFTLSEFAALNSASGGYGTFGVGVDASGNVIVSDVPTNTIYTFADTDGQTAASALFTQPGAGTSTAGMASAGGHVYGYDPQTGSFAQYNANGTVNHDLTGVAAGPYLGMAGVLAGPASGNIIATSSAGIIEINPTANGGLGSIVQNYGGSADGVSVSADGTMFCAEQGSINCYSVATGTLLHTASGFPSPDGTGLISGGSFSGDLIVNNNNGAIDLYDFATSAFTTIATGVGERGDYAMTDPTTGTLLLDELSGVWRLGCGGGCTIGGGGPSPSNVPEPMAIAVLGTGLVGLGLARRRSSD